MNKYFIVLLLLLSEATWAGEWIDVNPNFNHLEVTQDQAMTNAGPSIYFGGNIDFVTTQVCNKKRYIAIADEKLIDRAISVSMFSIATDKRFRIYVDGCSADGYLLGEAISLYP